MSSVLKNYRKIYTSPGGDPSLPPRVTTLENNEYKVTYYEVIQGTSGTLVVPSQGTINSDEFGLSGNAILSKIDANNKPTYESPTTSGGVKVTASLNVLTGAWVASGVYTDPNVALIYSIKIKAIYYSNLTYNNIIETTNINGVPTLAQVLASGNTTGGILIHSNGFGSTLDISDSYIDLQGGGANIFVSNSQNFIYNDNSIELTAPSVTKNSVEIATINDIPTKTSDLINDGDDGNPFISLNDLPSNLILYATTAASDIPTYVKLVSSITDPSYNTIAANVSTGAITTTNQFISALATSANVIVGNPGVINISTIGNIRRTSGTGNAEFYFEVWKRVLAGTETLIATSGSTPPVFNGAYAEFSATALWNDGIFIATDRIVLKFYATRVAGGSNPTYDFQFGGSTPVRSLVPIPLTVSPTPLSELVINKSDSYTASSSTTYSSTKALVDGLATKGAGTILGSVGATATLGTPLPYGSGVANTLTSSPFVAVWNTGTFTKHILGNTSTSQQQGYFFNEGGQYGGLFRYGSAFAATNFTGTSVPKANAYGIEAGNSNTHPIVFLGSPIIHGIGQTSTNVATRHDATGWRVGTMADVHTANTVAFEVAGVAKFNNVVRLKGYTVATLPTGTVGDTAYVTNALAPTYLGIAGGGGAITCKVFFNGTNWIT